MCRATEAGGRRCPGNHSPEHKQQVNQRRRELYAIRKNGEVRKYERTTEVSSRRQAVSHLTKKFPELGRKFNTVLPKKFNENLYTPIRNSDSFTMEKPYGALWCSPLYDDGSSAWQDFIQTEEHGTDAIIQDITLTDDSRVLVIDSYEDYVTAAGAYRYNLPVPEGLKDLDFFTDGPQKSMNYEEIAEDFDALYITRKALNECSYGKMYDDENRLSPLMAWDVPSLVVLNPKKITETPKQQLG